MNITYKEQEFLIPLPLWQAKLYMKVSKDLNVKKIEIGDIRAIFKLIDLMVLSLDLELMETKLNETDNIKMFAERGVDLTSTSLINLASAELTHALDGVAVSFHVDYGLTGNLDNVEIRSCLGVIRDLKSKWWVDSLGFDLGSTVFQSISTKFIGGVESYLANGRSTSRFLFSKSDTKTSDYMSEILDYSLADKKTVGIPIDPGWISFVTQDDIQVPLLLKGKKTNIGGFALRKQNGKRVFKIKQTKIRIPRNSDIDMKFPYEFCLADAATASPLVNVDSIQYECSFSTAVPTPFGYILRIPVRTSANITSRKSPERLTLTY